MTRTTTTATTTTTTTAATLTWGPMRHVRGMQDLQAALPGILELAMRLKHGGRPPRLLDGKTVILVFEKNSTRTRVSFEVGVQRLGGFTTIVDAVTSQMARGEPLVDTASVLSRYGDAIVYRAKDHASLLQMAEHSRVPVINALTDVEHPCQVLADFMTLAEHFGDLAGRRLAYVGDGNNMCHSYLLAAPMVGMDIAVACPAGYQPNPAIVQAARALAKAAGTKLTVTTRPEVAVHDADAVATDTWISMGDEAEEAARMRAFAGFTVDDALMARAAPGAVFLHCLPGHWGHEATFELAHGPRSLIYDEAENRMWVQMALLVKLLRPQGLPDA
jgi:ornithine carbamoyltransferase